MEAERGGGAPPSPHPPSQSFQGALGGNRLAIADFLNDDLDGAVPLPSETSTCRKFSPTLVMRPARPPG